MSERDPVSPRTNEPSTDEQDVLAKISEMIATVLEDVGGVDVEIGMDTQFIAHLGMESIDLVVLSTLLHDHYGGRVNFAEFVADFDLDELIEMNVGQLVRHVARSLAGTAETTR